VETREFEATSRLLEFALHDAYEGTEEVWRWFVETEILQGMAQFFHWFFWIIERLHDRRNGLKLSLVRNSCERFP
jgi:hypothetical protein